MTLRTKGVSPVTAQKYAYVHPVGARFHPIKKATNPIPPAAFPNFIRGQIRTKIAVNHPFLVGLRQIFEWAVDINLSIQRSGNQILLALAHLTGLKRLHDAVGDTEALIRHSAVQVDTNRPSESPASRTSSKRIVERKQAGCRRSNVDIAVGTMPAGGEPMFFDRVQRHDIELTLSVFQSLFNRFGQPPVIRFLDRGAILDDGYDCGKPFNLRLVIGTHGLFDSARRAKNPAD